MKSNFRRTFRRIDPVSLALIVMLGISATFAWVQITGGNTRDTSVMHQVTPPDLVEDDLATVGPGSENEIFSAPIAGDFDVTVSFFDEEAELDATTLVSSIFYYQVGSGKYSHPSSGASFRAENDAQVDVVAPLTGVVSEIIDDDPVRGTIVTLDHENGLQTVFTGVYNLEVEVGQTISQGDTLGVTGLSMLEPTSGNVVHLEVFQNGTAIDPEEAIGRALNDF